MQNYRCEEESGKSAAAARALIVSERFLAAGIGRSALTMARFLEPLTGW